MHSGCTSFWEAELPSFLPTFPGACRGAAFLTLTPWKCGDDASLAGSNHGNAPSFDVSRDAPLRRQGEEQSLFPSLHHLYRGTLGICSAIPCWFVY